MAVIILYFLLSTETIQKSQILSLALPFLSHWLFCNRRKRTNSFLALAFSVDLMVLKITRLTGVVSTGDAGDMSSPHRPVLPSSLFKSIIELLTKHNEMKWILMHHYAIFYTAVIYSDLMRYPHYIASDLKCWRQLKENELFVFIFHLSRHAHTAALGQTYPLKLQSVTQL